MTPFFFSGAFGAAPFYWLPGPGVGYRWAVDRRSPKDCFQMGVALMYALLIGKGGHFRGGTFSYFTLAPSMHFAHFLHISPCRRLSIGFLAVFKFNFYNHLLLFSSFSLQSLCAKKCQQNWPHQNEKWNPSFNYVLRNSFVLSKKFPKFICCFLTTLYVSNHLPSNLPPCVFFKSITGILFQCHFISVNVWTDHRASSRGRGGWAAGVTCGVVLIALLQSFFHDSHSKCFFVLCFTS